MNTNTLALLCLSALVAACSPKQAEPASSAPARHVEGSKLPVMPGAKPFKREAPPVPGLAASQDDAAAAVPSTTQQPASASAKAGGKLRSAPR